MRRRGGLGGGARVGYARRPRQMIECRPHAHPRDILNLVAGVAKGVQRPTGSGGQQRPYVQLEDEYQAA